MKRIAFFVIVCFVVSSLTIVPLFSNGFFPMHDDTQPTRIHLMHEALSEGQFPVRWVSDLGYGYGYPIFNFYAPFPYYVGAIIQSVGFDAIDSAKITFALVTIGAGFSMFVLLRNYFRDLPSLCGSLVYAFFPYHAVNLYVRGALSEQFGYFLFPFVMLSLLKIFEIKKKRDYTWIIFFGLSLGVLVISHNLSAILASAILIPFSGIILLVKKNKLVFGSVLLGGLLAFGLSAFYTLPLIFESSLTNVTSQVGGGADYKDHFVCVGQFWNSIWGFGGSAKGCLDGMSFGLGKANIVLTVFALITSGFVFYKKRKIKNLQFAALGLWCLVGSLFFMLPISKIIWDMVPSFEYIQYPWRFLTITGVGMAILIAYGVQDFGGLFKYKYSEIGLAILIIFVSLLNNAKLFKPQVIVSKDINHYIEKNSIRYNISKISDEYMPKNFIKPKSSDFVPRDVLDRNDTSLQIISEENSSKKYHAKVISKTGSEYLFNIAPFASWNLYIDGQKNTITNSNNGIKIFIPEGKHDVTLAFEQTPVQKMGDALSIISIMCVGAGIITKRFYGTKTS